MKNSKAISITFLSLVLVFTLSGCNSNTANNEKVITENAPKDSQENFQEDKGVITDTITFGDEDDLYGEIIKNKISKKAQIKAFLKINDEDEKSDFMGEEFYMAPFMVNTMCNLMNLAIFDPEKLSEMENKEEVREDNEMWKLIEDYKITEIEIKFIDAEDGTEIAKCFSTGKDSMKFEAYREYDPEKSFFKSEIGVFENSN